jgi:hypothetical protein
VLLLQPKTPDQHPMTPQTYKTLPCMYIRCQIFRYHFSKISFDAFCPL